MLHVEKLSPITPNLEPNPTVCLGNLLKKNCFCIFFYKKKTYFLNNKTIFQFIFNKLLFFKLNTARVLNVGRLCARRSRGLYTKSDLVNLIASTFTQTSRITPRHWTHLFSRVGSRHRPIQYFPFWNWKYPTKLHNCLGQRNRKRRNQVCHAYDLRSLTGLTWNHRTQGVGHP